MKKHILIICSVFFWFFGYSQQEIPSKILVTGKVLDSITHLPIEFATVSFKNNEKIVGTASDRDGNFSISMEAGVYTITFEFLSYSPKQFSRKELSSNTDLGVIYLGSTIEKLEEVEVTTQRNLIEFKFDRKIYNASKDIANNGGNALDVLDNTPSVRVDENGGIIVRGASATVLIDGKPIFGVNGSANILKTIPSNTIDKVEIITHSAKYSAEGGGVLNIVTKKRKDEGISGSIEAHVGAPDNNGVSFFFNEKREKISLFSTIAFNNGKNMLRENINQKLLGTGKFFESVGKDKKQRNNLLFSLGSDFKIDKNNSLSASFLVNTDNKNYISKLRFQDFDAAHTLEESAIRDVNDFEDGTRLETYFNYTTEFDDKGQQLSFDFRFENTISKDNASIFENTVIPISPTTRQKVAKDVNLDSYLVKLDYALPLNENENIELGYKSTFRLYKNDYEVSEFDAVLNRFEIIGNQDDVFRYNEKIHAFFGVYSGSKNNLSYSLGLRTEVSEITVKSESTVSSSHKNYTDLFPSAMVGYEFKNDSYLSFNYERSIKRPEVSEINPFLDFTNDRFQSVGTPNLNPSYSDIMVLEYSGSYNKITFLSSLYFSFSKDKLLAIIQDGGVNSAGQQTFRRVTINSGNENISLLELDLTYNPIKSLRFGTYISAYNLKLSKTLNNQYDYSSLVWFTDIYAQIFLKGGFRLKAQHIYQSPKVKGLTKLRTINSVDFTASKSLFKKKATISFKIRDVFKSKWFTRVSSEANANTIRSVRYDQRIVLSFSYNFNQKRKSSKDRSKELTKDLLEDKQDEKL